VCLVAAAGDGDGGLGSGGGRSGGGGSLGVCGGSARSVGSASPLVPTRRDETGVSGTSVVAEGAASTSAVSAAGCAMAGDVTDAMAGIGAGSRVRAAASPAHVGGGDGPPVSILDGSLRAVLQVAPLAPGPS